MRSQGRLYPAAAEAYRRAVDISPRDYRAWYGLGQTYELLHMPYYALYYFRRCVSLPESARRVILPHYVFQTGANAWINL